MGKGREEKGAGERKAPTTSFTDLTRLLPRPLSLLRVVCLLLWCIQNVMQNQGLMKGFDNPLVMQAVAEIAKDPKAINKYAPLSTPPEDQRGKKKATERWIEAIPMDG